MFKRNVDIGIMQGRLSPCVGERIQAFPVENWKTEFFRARDLSLASIEWIFESPIELNPLWTAEGIAAIQDITERTGVRVDYICADYFMESPFVRMSSSDVLSNQQILCRLIERAASLGARGIEIPFVDASEIRTAGEEDEVCRALEMCLEVADRLKILIGLETSLSAQRFKSLLRRIDHPMIRANYDIGNSASLGYDPHEEIAAYGEWIENVHIKDRMLDGGTVPLGTGNANIADVLGMLQARHYAGGLTLQAARGIDGGELSTVQTYIEQVRNSIESVRLQN